MLVHSRDRPRRKYRIERREVVIFLEGAKRVAVVDVVADGQQQGDNAVAAVNCLESVFVLVITRQRDVQTVKKIAHLRRIRLRRGINRFIESI